VSRLRREDGFTLVELLAAMFALGLLFSAFSLVFASVIHNQAQVQNEALFQEEARTALDRLARDLRQASTNDSSTQRIVTMTSSQLTFYAPDSASTTTYHLREISYRVAGGELDRQMAWSTNTNGPPWTMGSFGTWAKQVGNVVSTAAFTYLDSSGNVTTTAANVDTVQISLTLATVPSSGRQFTYSTSVTLRASQ
jgi:prepilin-type N-terminal cleavage/methylation domain-containing protein